MAGDSASAALILCACVLLMNEALQSASDAMSRQGSSMITGRCTHCQKWYRVEDEWGGLYARCRRCRSRFRILTLQEYQQRKLLLRRAKAQEAEQAPARPARAQRPIAPAAGAAVNSSAESTLLPPAVQANSSKDASLPPLPPPPSPAQEIAASQDMLEALSGSAGSAGESMDRTVLDEETLAHEGQTTSLELIAEDAEAPEPEAKFSVMPQAPARTPAAIPDSGHEPVDWVKKLQALDIADEPAARPGAPQSIASSLQEPAEVEAMEPDLDAQGELAAVAEAEVTDLHDDAGVPAAEVHDDPAAALAAVMGGQEQPPFVEEDAPVAAATWSQDMPVGELTPVDVSALQPPGRTAASDYRTRNLLILGGVLLLALAGVVLYLVFVLMKK